MTLISKWKEKINSYDDRIVKSLEDKNYPGSDTLVTRLTVWKDAKQQLTEAVQKLERLIDGEIEIHGEAILILADEDSEDMEKQIEKMEAMNTANGKRKGLEQAKQYIKQTLGDGKNEG